MAVDGVRAREPGDAPADDLNDVIRRLGNQLGETLVRFEGKDFLDLVEQVRSASKDLSGAGDTGDAGDLRTHLGSLDLPTAIRLARAFSSYFHLANLAEQVYREGGRAPLGAPGLPFVEVPGGNEPDPDVRRAAVAALDVRPVFTAHPTEAVPAVGHLQAEPDLRPARRPHRPSGHRRRPRPHRPSRR